ncbi:MAG: LPP20 family lipoprotein [Planctomycetota bacterium]|jgi:hypothetical protein
MRIRILNTVAVLAIMALALPALSVELTPQQKLLAKRAALVDAYRQLGERIEGLRIDANTVVKDFVTESDEIKTEMRAFLKGIKPVGEPRYYDDGTCEVDVEVTVQEVVTVLKRTIQKHYKGNRQVGEDVWERLVTKVETKVLQATGAGAPYPSDITDGQFDNVVMPTSRPKLNLPPIWREAGPVKRLKARRAAVADAYRQLGERINGLRISSTTSVKDFVTEYDKIKTEMSTFIRGAKVVAERYLEDGICEVDMQVTVEEVVTTLKRTVKKHYSGDRLVDVNVADNIRKETNRKVVRVTGAGTFKREEVKPRNWAETTREVTEVKDEKPAWATQVVRAKGSGVPPENVESEGQAKLLAKKAAERDALRNLAEQVNGVHITAETTVKDFVTESDEIKTEFQAFLKGYRIIGYSDLGDGSYECEIEISLDKFYEIYSKFNK